MFGERGREHVEDREREKEREGEREREREKERERERESERQRERVIWVCTCSYLFIHLVVTLHGLPLRISRLYISHIKRITMSSINNET